MDSPWLAIQTDGQEATWLRSLSSNDSYLAAFSTGTLGKSWIDPNRHWKLKYSSNRSRGHSISEAESFDSNKAFFAGVKGYGSLVGTSLSAMQLLLKNFSCDYIVRTNVSSYWNVSALKSFLHTVPKEEYYAGKTEKLFKGIPGFLRNNSYASGAGMILSADVAINFIRNHKKIPTSLIDDLAFGHLAFKLGISCTDLPRIDLGGLDQVQKLTRAEIANNFHYRCKSYVSKDGFSSRGDIEIMKSLHEKIGLS